MTSIEKIVRLTRDYWFNELSIRNGREYARTFYRPVFISALFPMWLSFVLLLVSLDFRYQTGFFRSITKLTGGPLLLLALVFGPYIFLSARLLSLASKFEIDEDWSKSDLARARKFIIPFLLLSVALLFLVPSTLAR